MTTIIDVSDLPATVRSHELVQAMVDGANAKASRVAPCLGWNGSIDGQPAPSTETVNEARLILIGAVKRWAEAGSGSVQATTSGPFGMTVDTRQRGGFNLWPSEITDLQALCRAGSVGRQAFSIDTVPSGARAVHADVCSIYFGGRCSCGADIAGEPLYELG